MFDHPLRLRRLATAGLLACVALVTTGIPPVMAADGPTGSSMSGPEAVPALGPRFDEAARRNGLTGEQLAETLRHDPTLHIDGDTLDGFYVEPPPAIPPQAPTTGADGADATTAPYPLDATFSLHSRPSSTRKIYLDFDGHTTTGTYWNSSHDLDSFASGAFDIDGAPRTFNSTERAAIQRVYLSMREDYAPFDVDVTTENPGVEALRRTSSTDQRFGTRVVLTPSLPWECGCGGIAYLGSFQWETDTPAFVLTNGVNGSDFTTKFMGEAGAHEVGHTLGLLHDGLTDGTVYYAGQGSWAPIMGVGYYRPVTQFSRGEYPNANNTEDDFAVMLANGVNLVPDDAGDKPATATALTVGSPTFRRIGIPVSRSGYDADVFRFSLSSTRTVTLDATQDGFGINPNLNLRIVVKDPGGNVVASASPTDSLAANLTRKLPAGTYYVKVTGAGEGTAATGYTRFGSLGHYRLLMSQS